jgi:hypothetical protein
MGSVESLFLFILGNVCFLVEKVFFGVEGWHCGSNSSHPFGVVTEIMSLFHDFLKKPFGSATHNADFFYKA